MKINVKYDDLEKLSSYIENKSTELESDFDDILKVFESVPSAWSGSDSQIFVEEAKKYIDEIKNNNIEFDTFSTFITTIVNDYKNEELNFDNNLKKEVS